MKTLLPQLKVDLKELFENNEDYPEFKDTIVKEKFEKYPKIHYPIISLSELNNEAVNDFINDSGEQVSYLGYQIEIDCEQTSTHTAIENVQIIGEIIDDYLKGERYWCLRRIGSFPKQPKRTDNNVIVGYLRYECNLDLNTNTFYRRV